MSRPLPCSFPAERQSFGKKDYIPHVHFVSTLGPGSGLRALSLQPFGPLTSVGLKELFLKTIVLLAFASAKRIEHLHAFSVDSDCIRFGPGDCSVTLRPRLEYVPKSLSTPFERTETVSPSALATKSSPSQSADAQTAICPVRALRFYIDRSSSFRQSIQLLGAMVRRAEAYRNKVCHTGLWTLSRRHIQPKVWKCPLHIRGRSTRAIFHLAWSRCMCIQDICLAAGGLRRIPSPGFTSWTFSP